MKILIFKLAILSSIIGYSQNLNLSNAFNADFKVDSVTLDVESTIVNCSGAAKGYENGDYSAVYLTYYFTNRMSASDSGEFTGLVWAQNGEKFLNETLQGIWRRRGQEFEIITLDNISDGNTILAVGKLNYAKRTLSFEASVVD